MDLTFADGSWTYNMYRGSVPLASPIQFLFCFNRSESERVFVCCPQVALTWSVLTIKNSTMQILCFAVYYMIADIHIYAMSNTFYAI